MIDSANINIRTAQNMRIVADENIPGLQETFGQFGKIVRYSGRQISSRELQKADVLLVRSVSRIDRQLVENSPLKFLGSATIGIDHMDIAALEEAGIHWCHAPGCNADGAAQYTLAMIMLAARRTGLCIAEIKAGIVGLGNVGSRLKNLLEVAGAEQVLACDPPLGETGTRDLVGMEEISDCNLVSFHVPLTDSGPYPTKHLANQHFFSQLKTGTLLVNSSRGDVVEPKALLDWLDSGAGEALLDVWPNEPTIESSLLEKVLVATPHVAGYSLDGKLNGTRMLFRQFLQWQGINPVEPLPPALPYPQELELPSGSGLQSAILAACPVELDDRVLRSCSTGIEGVDAVAFDLLRKNYPSRRDFGGTRLTGSIPASLAKQLDPFGFVPCSHRSNH